MCYTKQVANNKNNVPEVYLSQQSSQHIENVTPSDSVNANFTTPCRTIRVGSTAGNGSLQTLVASGNTARNIGERASIGARCVGAGNIIGGTTLRSEWAYFAVWNRVLSSGRACTALHVG